MNVETRFSNFEVALTRDADGEPTSIFGYASVFYQEDDPGTEYQLFPGLIERIAPTAFDRALAERDDVRALFNHESDNLLGRTESGTLILRKDAAGLAYQIDIDEGDPDHARVISKIERGDLTGSSFSFVIEKESFEHQEEGPDIRIIESVQLWDVGPVTFPAYEGTSAGIRTREFNSNALKAWEAWKAAEVAGARLDRSQAARRARLVEVGLTMANRPA